MSIHFANQNKLHTTSDIDLLICAEIPDPVTQSLLYETMKSTMMHGPCGNVNPDCPCMINSKCSKNYPKEFNNTTTLGHFILNIGEGMISSESWKKRGKYGKTFLDNTSVIPYNPYLYQRYNCHINVESCHNIKAVKYLYKYIYKGREEGSVRFNQSTPEHNEIDEYVEGRYVSAPEADNESALFKPGEEDIALKDVRYTALTAWFELNKADKFCNVDIFQHF